MKKNLFFISAIIIASCSKDDIKGKSNYSVNSSEKKMLGKWMLKESHARSGIVYNIYTYNNTIKPYVDFKEEAIYEKSYKLFVDGAGLSPDDISMRYVLPTDHGLRIINRASWKVDENTNVLICGIDELNCKWDIVSLNDKELTISHGGKISINGDTTSSDTLFFIK